WHCRPELIALGAICFRNPALSSSEPSGLVLRKSSVSISPNHLVSDSCTERIYPALSMVSVSRSFMSASPSGGGQAIDPPRIVRGDRTGNVSRQQVDQSARPLDAV